VWAAEVKRVTQLREVRWTRQLGKSKMRSLRALLEELAATVEGADVGEQVADDAASPTRQPRRRRA
jgi:hypothetical protein